MKTILGGYKYNRECGCNECLVITQAKEGFK